MTLHQQDDVVSILLPVRNAEKTLERCLDSLLAQTYEHVEIIAIDDKSNDTSYKILRRYRTMDKRLKISRNVKHYGLAVTLNRAVRQAHGQYLAFMNPHDSQTPDRIKRQVNHLKRNPKVVAVGTQALFTDQAGRKKARSNFPTDDNLIKQTFLTADSLQLESLMLNRYLLPKDLVKFADQKHPLLYRSLLVKMLPYGQFNNLNHCLYLRTREETMHFDAFNTKLLTHLVLWLKARFIYDSQPSVRSLLTPFNTRLKSLT
jgi:glycosyltransferase involved in cell wall biosynthesis